MHYIAAECIALTLCQCVRNSCISCQPTVPSWQMPHTQISADTLVPQVAIGSSNQRADFTLQHWEQLFWISLYFAPWLHFGFQRFTRPGIYDEMPLAVPLGFKCSVNIKNIFSWQLYRYPSRSPFLQKTQNKGIWISDPLYYLSTIIIPISII